MRPAIKSKLRPNRRAIRPLLAALTLLAVLLLAVALPASAAAPVVTIDPASDVTFNSAKATGEVNPEGEEVNYHFEYVTDAQFEEEPDPVGSPGVKAEWASAAQAGFGTIPAGTSTLTPVEPATLEGLAPGTTYHLRLVAENTSGERAEAVAPNFPTTPVNPPSVSGLEVSALTASSAHFEATVKSGGSGAGEAAGGYRFACSPECPGIEGEHEFGAEGFADGADHAVEVDATGLEPGLHYTVSILARNARTDAVPPAAEESRTFPTVAVAPGLETDEVHGYVTDTTTELIGAVDPHNSPTTYRFEYGTTAAYGSSSPLSQAPEGNKPETVLAKISGLAPQTTYHYRLVADNGTGGGVHGEDRTLTTKSTPAPGGECPNQAIREEQGSTHLPECMAYELVSPPETSGMNIEPGQVMPDGDHAFLGTVLPADPGQVTGNFNVLEQMRTPDGWVTHDLAAGAPRDNHGYNSTWSSEGGSRTILLNCDFSVVGCPGSVELDLVGLDGSFKPLLTVPHAGFAAPLPGFPGASADLSTLLISQGQGQPPLDSTDTHAQGKGLYALHPDGSLEYVAVDSEGHALPCGAVLAAGGDESRPGTGFEQIGVSADGRSLVYTSPDPEVLGAEGCPSVPDVYLRRDAHSIDVSAPRAGNPEYGGSNPDEGATFVGSSRDGRYVFFTTATRLAASDQDSAVDLYRYDADSDSVDALTSGAEVERVSVSPNGDYVYFTAADPIDGHGVRGEKNLYSWHDGQISYIATLHGSVGFGQPLGTAVNTAAITPDGRQIVFSTNDPVLTHQPEGVELEGRTQFLTQILRYNVGEDSITCISCRADGAPTPAETSFPKGASGRATNTRFQSDDGATVGFVTSASLDPRDVNGEPDTYIWHDGRTSLISDGKAATSPATIGLALSADGRSVFFSSFAELTPAVRQTNLKVYVARVDGGFATEPQATPCTVENCREPTAAATAAASAGTTAFTGPPNPKPKHKKKHQKHHKKKHTKQHHQKKKAGKKSHKRAPGFGRGGQK